MSDDLEKTLYTTHRSIQDKHVYFLLAAAGAAIGFAFTQTTGAVLHWSQAPLGVALCCWGLSFYCGCRHVDAASAAVYLNNELLRIRAGLHPGTQGRQTLLIKIGEQVTLEGIEKHRDVGRTGAAVAVSIAASRGCLLRRLARGRDVSSLADGNRVVRPTVLRSDDT